MAVLAGPMHTTVRHSRIHMVLVIIMSAALFMI
jgi:hypothetical protein